MRHGLLLASILFAAVSCLDHKDYDLHSVDVSPSMVFPLAYGDMTIQDILKGSDSVNIKVYPDDLVYLEYSSTLISEDIRDQFNIPDKSINQSFPIPQGTIPSHSIVPG